MFLILKIQSSLLWKLSSPYLCRRVKSEISGELKIWRITASVLCDPDNPSFDIGELIHKTQVESFNTGSMTGNSPDLRHSIQQ